MKALQFIAQVTLVLLVIDFFGFAMWAMSGQQPVDNFYVGSITAHAIKAVIQ